MLKNVRLARQRKILSELAEECQTEGVRSAYSPAAVVHGSHIVRNQENRALEYRVSLRVPSSRESRVGWRPGRGGTPATALLGQLSQCPLLATSQLSKGYSTQSPTQAVQLLVGDVWMFK